MSASTALKVLSNHALRWSSPAEFNDPFDVPRELAYDISPKEIKVAMCKLLIKFIENKEHDISHLSQKTQSTLKLIRSSNNQTIEEMIMALSNEETTLFDLSPGIEGLRGVWRGFISEFRILCLTEVNDAASMWYHYADKYQGVVIGILCSDELDSPWLLARPIGYPTEPPHLFSAEGWAEMIITPYDKALEKILDAYTYTKTPDWSYEKEWRITSFKGSSEIGTTSDYKFDPRHFANIFFGPLIDQAIRQNILSFVSSKMPSIELYDVGFGLNRRFSFNKINIG